MTHAETIAIHFVGYNLLHGAVNEVSGSLKLVRDLSNQTGVTMTTWNQRITATTNEVALANARYADVVRATTATVFEAAHDQALAWNRAQAASDALAISTQRLTAVMEHEAEVAQLIATRSYTAAEREDLYTASQNRLAVAMGERAAVEQRVVDANLELAASDQMVANVSAEAAFKQKLAADTVIVAEEKKTAAVSGAAAAQVASFRTASAAAMGVGTGFLVGAGIAAAGLAFATSKASDFVSQVNLLHTQARVATSQLPELSAGMLSMAGNVGFSATELAKALYLIESVGGGSMTAAHALRELEAAAKGAAVGHADLTQTANALASVMAVFPKLLPIQAMGQLDAIVGQGKMTMEDLNGALRTGILATLHSANISLGDFGGALATMTDYGIPAIQAANSLRMAIYLMTAPTIASDKVLKIFGLTAAEASSAGKKFSDAFAEVGIRHAKLADDLAKPGGIILALQHLRAQMIGAGLDAQGQAEVIYKAFGGGKMGKAVVTLYENIAGGARASDNELKKLGFTDTEIATLHDRLIQKTELINKQINLLGQNFSFLLANDPTQLWNNFTAGVNALIVALGETFIPILMTFIGFITPIVNGMTGWIATHKELAGAIISTGLVLMTVFGFAMILVGGLGLIGSAIAGIAAGGAFVFPVVGAIFVGLTLLAGLLTGAVVLVHAAWGSMATLWDTRVVPSAQRIWNSLQAVWKIIQDGLAITKPIFDKAFDDFRKTLTEHGGLWDNATSAFQNFSNNLLTFIKSPLFATLVADFAVTLPAAIGLTLDAVINLADAAQLAFTLMVTSTRVALALLAGNYVQAAQIAKDSAPEIVRLSDKLGYDMAKSAHDANKLVNGEYTDMWNQVYNGTMYQTNKLGNDGKTKLENAGDKWVETVGRVAKDVRAQAQYTFQGVGLAMGDGILSGMVQREQAIHAQAERMVSTAAAYARATIRAQSPSKLFAEQVGSPMALGIGEGIEMEFPTVYRKVSNFVVGLADQKSSSPEVPVISSSKTSSTSNGPTKFDTSRLEDLLTEGNTILKAIRDDTPQIDAFAAQKRTG